MQKNNLTEPLVQKKPSKIDWLPYSIFSCLTMGTVNFFHGELSSRHSGVKGSYPFCFGIGITWLIYHLCFTPPLRYFTREKVNWQALGGIAIRGTNHGVLILATFYCFMYATLAGVNLGVIASIFTSGVFFTAFAFYLVYDEKLSMQDWIGICFIVVGVSLIGIFKPNQDVPVKG